MEILGTRFAIIDPMNRATNQPLIIGFISDLMFIPRLEDIAGRLGFQYMSIEDSSQITSSDPLTQTKQFAEHITGPGAVLLDKISSWSPALLVFDLGNHGIPWRDWIVIVKSAPATRRIPVVCFGSHKNVESMQAAKQAGANAVVARSRFVNDLPELILKYARVIDYAALDETCLEKLSLKALHGLELFNRQEYFLAHEVLEEAWNEDASPGRELYRAVIQVAVGYLQIQRRNYAGAVKMFLRLRQWIDPLPEECRGVNVAKLRQDAEQVYQRLVALGNERISEFDHLLLQPVDYKN
jgi:uncharacterized protein